MDHKHTSKFNTNVTVPEHMAQIAYMYILEDFKQYAHGRTVEIDTTREGSANFIKGITEMDSDQATVYTQHDRNEFYVTVIYPDDHIMRAWFNSDGNNGWLQTHATTAAIANEKAQAYKAHFPSPDPQDPNVIRVGFWSAGPQGHGQLSNRDLASNDWSLTQYDYVPPVRKELQKLIDVRETDIDGGKLILWHGPPGTGKTSAIRALAREWKDWCATQYVLDPEVLFNHAGYMVDVLLRDIKRDYDWDDPDPDEGKYRLLIVEDSEEFLLKEGNTKGQGLARLLNVTDGLIGQGMRCLVLITTNEDINVFHEAVIRPGRCLANIKFDLFDGQETSEWWANKDREVPDHSYKNQSLADLYAQYADTKVIETNKELIPTGQYL